MSRLWHGSRVPSSGFGQTGEGPIFQGAPGFDFELLENRTLDGNTNELIYRPTLH